MSYWGFDYDEHKVRHAGSVEFFDGYEWDTITIVQHKVTGEYFWVRESGCSCDGPLYNITDLSEFDGRGTFYELSGWLNYQAARYREEFESYPHGTSYGDRHPDQVDADVVETLASIRRQAAA